MHDPEIYACKSMYGQIPGSWGVEYTPKQLPGFHLPMRSKIAIMEPRLREMDQMFDLAEQAVVNEPVFLQRVATGCRGRL